MRVNGVVGGEVSDKGEACAVPVVVQSTLPVGLLVPLLVPGVPVAPVDGVAGPFLPGRVFHRRRRMGKMMKRRCCKERSGRKREMMKEM